MNPIKLHKIVELVGELEELLGVSTTFLYGESDTDIRGVLLADMELTNDILGEPSDRETMN